MRPLSISEARSLIDAELSDRDSQEEGYISEHLRRFVETINFMAPVAPGSKVLDIGVYDGALDVLVKNRFSARVSGVDVRTPDNVKWTERFQRLGIEFRFCDLLTDRIPFGDGEFDVVTLCEVIEHFPSVPTGIFKEVRRVLKQDGTFVLTCSNVASLYRRFELLFGKSPIRFYRDYTREELVRMLEGIGFEVQSTTFRDYRRIARGRAGGVASSGALPAVEAVYGVIASLYPRFRNSLLIKALATR